MTAAEILAASRSMLGTPFMHQGRVPGVALDCAGLVVAVAHQLGLDPHDPPGYGRIPAHGLLQQTLDGQSLIEPVAVQDIQPGDILLMRFAKEPQHLAIYAGQTIIHSYADVSKVVEHELDDLWRRRIVAAYRFVEVEA